mgnify:CR=1 FL=1
MSALASGRSGGCGARPDRVALHHRNLRVWIELLLLVHLVQLVLWCVGCRWCSGGSGAAGEMTGLWQWVISNQDGSVNAFTPHTVCRTGDKAFKAPECQFWDCANADCSKCKASS